MLVLILCVCVCLCVCVYVCVCVSCVFVCTHALQTEQFFLEASAVSGHNGPPGALVVHGYHDPTLLHSLHHAYLQLALNASETLSQTLRDKLSKITNGG